MVTSPRTFFEVWTRGAEAHREKWDMRYWPIAELYECVHIRKHADHISSSFRLQSCNDQGEEDSK